MIQSLLLIRNSNSTQFNSKKENVNDNMLKLLFQFYSVQFKADFVKLTKRGINHIPILLSSIQSNCINRTFKIFSYSNSTQFNSKRENKRENDKNNHSNSTQFNSKLLVFIRSDALAFIPILLSSIQSR